MQFRSTFTTPYDQYADREGQAFTVLGLKPREEYNADECGPLYLIRFADGTEIEAWPGEVINE